MCITESLNARSPTLKFHRDLKAATTAAVADIEAGRSPPTPLYTSPVKTSAYRSPVRPVHRGDTSERGNDSPSPNRLRYVVNGGMTPKRKHDTFSLRDHSPHGDGEGPEKMPRLEDECGEVTERFMASMAVMGEFTKKLRSPGSRSSPRGSVSP